MTYYPLAFDSWGREERAAIMRVLGRGRYTMGLEVAAFEREFADWVGAGYAAMVNSGSSANLLAIAALTLDGRLRPGDEVIVPAVSWSTTYFPVHQHGLTLRFVDVDPLTLNIDPALVEAAVTDRTRAVFAVNLLGNPCAFAELERICAAHRLVLLVDNCESLGAEYQGREAGAFGALGTYSFFFSHHLQTMEGGMVVTNDRRLWEMLRSLRAHGWVRDLPETSAIYPKAERDWFDDAFRFVLPGYSVRPLEMSGAVGREQLRKLARQLEARRRNARAFMEAFGCAPWFEPYIESGSSSWFGFPVRLTGELKGRRREVIEHLRANGVETRPIVAGNFTRHPVMAHLNVAPHGADDFPVADRAHLDGFFLGNDSRDLTRPIRWARKLVEDVAAAPRAHEGDISATVAGALA